MSKKTTSASQPDPSTVLRHDSTPAQDPKTPVLPEKPRRSRTPYIAGGLVLVAALAAGGGPWRAVRTTVT